MKLLYSLLVVLVITSIALAQPTFAQQRNCSPSYPDICIAPAPPDLDCGDVTDRNFQVTGDDPHRFDGDKDGVGCDE